MTEKQKAYVAFESAMQRIIKNTGIQLDRKVRKAMNAIGPNGFEYQTEEDVMDAYAYQDITNSEKDRLLKALEYKTNRPRLKEDYMIAFCRQSLHLINDEQYADAQKQKQRDIRNKIVEIQRNGGIALICSCCKDVIGVTDHDGQRHEYPNYRECTAGRVCVECLQNCHNQCKDK